MISEVMVLRNLLVITLLLIPSLSWGVTYKIGSDPSDDYASWTAMQVAVSEAAGDTVSFRKGETFNEMITVPDSGTSGSPITYTSHGTGGLPIIDGQATRDYGIIGTDKDFITITKLKLQESKIAQINIVKAEDWIVEFNEFTGSGSSSQHGVRLDGDVGNDSSNIVVRYNFAHDLTDDCFWSLKAPALSNYWYGNVCLNSGDDCFDAGGGSDGASYSYWYNNTCYSTDKEGIDEAFGPTCLDCEADDCIVEFINNICVMNMTAFNECDNGEGCFLYMPNKTDANNGEVFSNNIYYSMSGSGENRFYLGGGTDTQFNFTAWQGKTGSPDASPSSESNPLINRSLYGVTQQGSAALKQGQNMCSTIGGYLEVGSTWLNDNVTVFTPCPNNPGNEWNIGAYGTRGECPVSIKY